MYKFIKWRDDWLLHIADLDGEHRHLVALINRIAERFGIVAPRDGVAGAKTAGEGEIYSMLEQLGEEVRRHFRHEEGFMEELDSPGYALHHYEHITLLAEYADLLRQVRRSGVGYLDFQTLVELKAWFISHIAGADRQFGEYYRELVGGNSARARRDCARSTRSWEVRFPAYMRVERSRSRRRA